jgi:hypothetical protein
MVQLRLFVQRALQGFSLIFDCTSPQMMSLTVKSPLIYTTERRIMNDNDFLAYVNPDKLHGKSFSSIHRHHHHKRINFKVA